MPEAAKKIVHPEWTPEEVETMRRMAKQGKLCKQVAHAINKTTNAVAGKAYRVGLCFNQEKYAAGRRRAW